MTTDSPDSASARQITAADPRRSTWLTANAGSGKTRVLTDRVARLLLNGTAPDRILCLTYTKAAAGEMQNRLLGRLGAWAMMPDAALTEALRDMAVATDDLPAARRLFARAIEAPGGLKVQTIHAFCAAVLRRFPLEAGISPNFSELDERSAAQLRSDVLEAMAAERVPEIDDLVGLHSGHDIDRFLAAITDSAARFDTAPQPQALHKLVGLPFPYGAPDLIAQVLTPHNRDTLAALIPHLDRGGSTDQTIASALRDAAWDEPGLAELALLENHLLYGHSAKNPFGGKLGRVPTASVRKNIDPHVIEALEALMQRVADHRLRHLALRFCEKSLALHRFAHAYVTRYDAEKLRLGRLDFNDLIQRTARLLDTASMAQWVLYRLDGGIDHILVDEAQDTSPWQWQVIDRLVEEFTAGDSAASATRTLFVVGDPKQSIYSFQGADAQVFSHRRTRFEADFAAAGKPAQTTGLTHSFRSSPAILELVDHVFDGPAGDGLGDRVQHRAFHDDHPGRVDLWPLLPHPEAGTDPHWTEPTSGQRPVSAAQTLARAVAAQVAALIGTPLREPRSGAIRTVGPGDVMILLEKRQPLAPLLTQALKAAGLPVAGADQVTLSDVLAVKDILAVLSVLATPEDDLALASALRSPIFGISEADLYRLAAGRGTDSLWSRLRASAHVEANALLSDMLSVSLTLRPFELISRLLIRHDARTRLIARLGPETEDAIAELLTQALAFERDNTPSLTGFLVWIGEGQVAVKRRPTGGDVVRVLTVHGAKGLESPIVILPDCGPHGDPPQQRHLTWPDRPATWRPSKHETPEVVAEALATERLRAEEEHRRLLYVALTRAESWLIVAGIAPKARPDGTAVEADPGCWHSLVAVGMDRAEAARANMTPLALSHGEGRRLSVGAWPAPVAAEATPPKPLPGEEIALRRDLAARPAPMRRPPQPLQATALRPHAQSASGSARPRAEAALYGTRLHRLLEHLPALAREDRPARAAALLAEDATPEADAAGLAATADALIDDPALAAIFAPTGASVLNEVAFALPTTSPLGTVVGTIDRLIVRDDSVLAIDYKSATDVPDTPEAVAAPILAQLAAYREALAAIYPGRSIALAILWTQTRRLMPVADAILTATWRDLTAPDPPPSSEP